MSDIPQTHSPKRSRCRYLPAIILCLIGMVVFAVGAFRFFEYVSDRDEKIENRALDIALASRAFVSAEQIEDVIANGESQSLEQSLRTMNTQWDGAYDIALYVKKGNGLMLAAGSDADLLSDGTDKQHLQPMLNAVPLVMEPLTNAQGSWGRVLVPLGDNAVPSAALCIRFPAYGWSSGLTSKAIDIGAIVFFSELLLFLVYRAYKKNSRIKGVSTTLQQRETVFKSLINSLPMGIAIGESGEKTGLTVNQRFGDILGIKQSDIEKMTIDELMNIDNEPKAQSPSAMRKQDSVSGYSTTKKIFKPDGQSAWVNMYAVSMNKGKGVNEHHLCIMEDITQRMLMETALRESERSKAVILAHLPGMAYRCRYDREWTMLFISEGCEKLTGYHPESLLYNKEITFNDLIVTEYREGLWREWERILALNIPFQGEYEIVAKNGVRKWVMEMGQGIYDTEGNVVALEGLIIDMTAKKLGEAQIKHMSDHDFLTGLYNRKFFEEEKARIKGGHHAPVSVIMSNINGVRLINDAFGYTEGDRVIIDAASIMKRRCQEGDILARTGGDEFGLLLPDTDARQVSELMQNISKAFEQYNSINPNRRYDISITLGCGTANPGENVEKAAKDAEESMHNNKLLNRKSSHSAILSSVMATMFERSQETQEHAERLGQLSRTIGEMLNLPQKNLVELELFSMLHDIGKVGIDDHILNKPGKLTDEEWVVMKKHPEIGYRIAMSSPELEQIAEYILSHHERWDGNGYPLGLKGEKIPLLSRILAVADAYDAMTEDRVYRKALSKQEALSEIERNAGTQFDPVIAQKFITSLKDSA